jgi:hypothetical protein
MKSEIVTAFSRKQPVPTAFAEKRRFCRLRRIANIPRIPGDRLVLRNEDPMTARYTRTQAAAYVEAEHGLPCNPSELERLASHGGGPEFQRLDGLRPLYSKDSLDRWAKGRLGPLVNKASDDPIRGRSRTKGRPNIINLDSVRESCGSRLMASDDLPARAVARCLKAAAPMHSRKG